MEHTTYNRTEGTRYALPWEQKAKGQIQPLPSATSAGCSVAEDESRLGGIQREDKRQWL